MVIHPDVIVTPDTPTVRFNQPREQIDLDKEISRILHAQGWGCGTYFNVQFLNHEKTKLLSCGRFVVTDETESVQTNDANPYQTMTKTVFSRRAEQVGEWWPNVMRDNIEVAVLADGIGNQSIEGSFNPPLEEPKRRGRPPKAA